MTLTLAFGAMVLMAVSDFLLKWGQRFAIRSTAFMLTQSVTYLPIVFIVAWLRKELIWHPALLLGLVGGVLGHLSLRALVSALASGDAVALVPVYRLSFVVSAALAVIFLGEQLTVPRLAALCFAAAAMLSMGGNYLKATAQRRAFGLAMLSMLLFGVGVFVFKLGMILGATPALFNGFQSIGYVLTGCVLLAGERDPQPMSRPAAILALTVGALLAAAWLCQGFALADADAVVVVPVVQLSFVLTALLAVVALGERLTITKALGILFAAAAVFLLARF